MTTSPKKSAASTTEPDDLGASQIQAKFDEANAQGYFGTSPDQTPRDHYTLAGVTADKPTPETTRGQ